MATGIELALAALLALQGFAPPRRPAAPAPPIYPYEIVAVDAIWGHLTEGRFKEPVGVFFEPAARELYVADSKNGLIGIHDAEGTSLFAFGGTSLLMEPKAVLAFADGSIYVLEAAQTRLLAFNYRGEPRPPVEFLRPVEAGGVPSPIRIGAFTRGSEGRWIVSALEPPGVFVFEPDLELVHELPQPKVETDFRTISDVALSREGLLAVTDLQGTPVHVFDGSGKLVTAFGGRDIGLSDFTAPIAAAFDELGFLYVVDLLRHDVKVFTSTGEFAARFGGWFSPDTGGRGGGELLYPSDIAITPEGTIYVAERFGQRVQIFERRPKGTAAAPPPPDPSHR